MHAIIDIIYSILYSVHRQFPCDSQSMFNERDYASEGKVRESFSLSFRLSQQFPQMILFSPQVFCVVLSRTF